MIADVGPEPGDERPARFAGAQHIEVQHAIKIARAQGRSVEQDGGAAQLMLQSTGHRQNFGADGLVEPGPHQIMEGRHGTMNSTGAPRLTARLPPG